jgi:hypothetical protein
MDNHNIQSKTNYRQALEENILMQTSKQTTTTTTTTTTTIIITMIQFNSILYYLCAESTAVRPITDTAQCSYK